MPSPATPAPSDPPNPPLGLRLSSLALGLGRVPALQSPATVLGLGLAMVVAIAAADYATGYEIRLAILQLIPIALVTWLVGRRWGLALSAIAVAAWFIAFRSSHYYSHEFYFYWEAAALVATYVVVVVLLARLRDALARSDERFVRALESLPSAVCVTDRASGRVLLSNQRHAELARGAGAALDPQPVDGVRERSDPATGHWYLVETVPLRWLDGSEAALTSFTDITESKQAQAVLAGRNTREIAQALFVSAKTVEFHRARIKRKLGVATTAELFRVCLLLGAEPPTAR